MDLGGFDGTGRLSAEIEKLSREELEEIIEVLRQRSPFRRRAGGMGGIQ
jgi:hypothetical protein